MALVFEPCVPCLSAQGTREDDDVVSEDLVQQDVQDLYEAGELKWGTDEAQFIYILGNRSKQHLRLGKQVPEKTYSCSLAAVPRILFSFLF